MKKRNDTKTPGNSTFRWILLFTMTFGLITYVPLRAQEGGETKDDEVVEDEIPILPAYRVDDSQDYRYRATSSMTAIRLTRQVIDSL